MSQFCRPPRPVHTLSFHTVQDNHDSSEFIIKHEDIESLRVIGSGAFGEVSEGVYKPRGEKVAIKKLHIVKSDARNEELFRREVDTLSRCTHPFLLPFVGYTDTTPYCILTKFISNGSLYNALHETNSSKNNIICNNNSNSIDNSIDNENVNNLNMNNNFCLTGTDLTIIAYGIAAGMQYLHSLDVLHRDLKTQNVLLNKHKIPIICDFGSSRKAEAQKTMTMNSAGTSNYMAPEFFVGGHYNKEVDVYSYGMILWEMLTKEVPFYGLEAPQVIYTVVILKNRPEIPDDAPPKLRQLIEMCWAQEPTARPSFDKISRLFETGEVQFPGNNRTGFKEVLERYLRKSKNKPAMRTSSKPQLTPFVGVPKHIATTPPLPRMVRHRDSLPVIMNDNTAKSLSILTAQRANAYLLTLNANTPQLATVIDFFSSNIDNNTLPPINLWPQFLDLLNNAPPDMIPQIQTLTIKFAQNHDILDMIEKVPNLHSYISDNTIDLFLYVVNFVAKTISVYFVAALMDFSIKTEKNSMKAIILLYKIMSTIEAFQPKILIFFRTNILTFLNREGGDVMLKALVVFGVATPEMITGYAHSTYPPNIIAAYEATFSVPWGKAEFFTLQDVLVNMVSGNEKLRLLSFEFIRKFAEGAMGAPLEMICSSLLKAANLYGCEEAILLLCNVASKPSSSSNVLLSSANVWLLTDRPILFLNLFMVLMIDPFSRNFLMSLKEAYVFIARAIKAGPQQEMFLIACYIIKICDITAKIAVYLSESKIIDYIVKRCCEIPRDMEEELNLSILAICKVAPIVDNENYPELVKNYLSMISERSDAYLQYVVGLTALAKQTSTHTTFVNENVVAVFSRLSDPKQESKPYIKSIFNDLKQSGKLNLG